MPRLTEVTFVSDGHTYRLALDFDDAALAQDTIAFNVMAERTGGEAGLLRVTAKVEIRAEDHLLVRVGDHVIYEARMGDLLGHGVEPVEEFIENLPPELAMLFGVDPVVGCAVKAGISAIIGQAIDCARALEYRQGWRIFADYLRCMREHFGQISKTALYRAFRCIYRLGI